MRVVVFGVDTAVGGAVAHYLSTRCEVIGVRLTVNHDPLEYQYADGSNPAKEGEVHIPSKITVRPCNLELVENVENIIRGADACFVHTFSNFYDPRFMAIELEQGRNIATACARQKIPHTIVCTQPHTLDLRGIGCRHFIGKAETEEYMRSTVATCTFLILPRFYEEILQFLAPEERREGFVFELPLDDKLALNMMTYEDLGRNVHEILTNKEAYTDKRLPPIRLVGDKVLRAELAAYLSGCLRLPFFDHPVTNSQYRSADLNRTERRPWREDYANMFQFLTITGFDHMKPPTDRDYHRLNASNTRFGEWVEQNREHLREAFTRIKPGKRLAWWFDNVVYAK